MTRGTRFVTVGQDETPVGAERQVETSTGEGAASSADSGWAAESYEEDVVASRDWSWLVPTTAVIAILAWTAFFGWSLQADLLAPGAPSRWTWWISSWATPVLLVCVVWLLALRHSRSEARRFGNVAHQLSVQSDALETRLSTVNQELSLAREFIAAQSRDLESLGRIAAERLSTHADRLQALIADNSAQVDAIGTVSQTALDNMERLRGQLPVIASSAKDVTNNIGNAGRTAHAQLIEMVSGFSRLNEFGKASERQVAITRQSIGEAIAEFIAQADQLDIISSVRFAALTERGAEFRAQIDEQEVEALAAIRSRAQALVDELAQSRDFVDHNEEAIVASLRARLGAIRDDSAAIVQSLRETEASALGTWQSHVAEVSQDIADTFAALETADLRIQEAARVRREALVEDADEHDALMSERSSFFAAEIDRRREESIEQDAAVLAQFSERLQALDIEIAQRRGKQQEEAAALAAHGEAITLRLAELQAQIAEVAAHGGAAEASLSGALQSLSTRFTASREALAATGRDIEGLTDSSVRLLELIQAGAQHSSKDLPEALAAGTVQLEGIEGRIYALRDAVEHANTNSDKLSSYVLAAGEAIRSTIGELEVLHDRIDVRAQQHVEGIESVRSSMVIASAELDDLTEKGRSQIESVAERGRVELSAAIDLLAHTARDTVSTLEEQSAAAVTALAQKLTDESRAAIDETMQARAAEIAGQLEAATVSAAGISREATMQLRDQLVRVNELTGNLERRIAHARERAEEQVGEDFTRRVALITETLNSNAIDIAKALSSDVSDSSWASYLKGDRGIFTRRAVTLLSNSEARAIGQLYHADRDFAEHVNRYIQEFETMLRQLLSTRDGHALGVTILSSDMGKLYVALAQGIDRIRH